MHLKCVRLARMHRHSTQTKSACVLHLSRFRSCWIQQNVCMASFGLTLNSEHWTHIHTLNERWNMFKLTLNTYHVVKDNRMNVVRFQDNLFTVSNYEINKLTCFPIWKGTTVSDYDAYGCIQFRFSSVYILFRFQHNHAEHRLKPTFRPNTNRRLLTPISFFFGSGKNKNPKCILKYPLNFNLIAGFLFQLAHHQMCLHRNRIVLGNVSRIIQLTNISNVSADSWKRWWKWKTIDF